MKKLSNLVFVMMCMSVSAGMTWWLATEHGVNPISEAVAETAGAQSDKTAGADAHSDKNSDKLASEAATPEAIAGIKQAIQKRFSQARPDLVIGSVGVSDISGLYTVVIENGPTVYVTADGANFIMGDLFQVLPGGFVNVAERAREGERAVAMAGVSVDNMIVFAPEQQPSKAVINVFTDVDCYYCQKLHNEVPDLNRAGIEVRYLAFPRAGIGSESYKKIASAWCAKDQQEAMTKLKSRQQIEQNVCDGNPVQEQYALGQKIGVSGTPALITEKGRLMPGYMPTLQLAQALGVELAPELASELMRKSAAQPKR
jgi:thiol:disulfide interchange protein DsbC